MNYGSYKSATVTGIVTVMVVEVSCGCSYVITVFVVTSGVAYAGVNVLTGFADLSATRTYGVFTVHISVIPNLDLSYRAALVTGFVTSVRIDVSSLSQRTADVTVGIASVCIGVARGSSYTAANVTVRITGVIVCVINSNSLFTALVTGVIAYGGVLVTCISHDAANVTCVIATVCPRMKSYIYPFVIGIDYSLICTRGIIAF